MNYKLIIFITCLYNQASSQFNFLFDQGIEKTFFKVEQQQIIKVEFYLSDTMSTSNTVLTQHVKDLMVPFDLDADKIKKLRTDNNLVATQIGTFVVWVGKLRQFYNEYIAIVDIFSEAPIIEYQKNISITVDDKFAKLQFMNIDSYVKQIIAIFTEAKTIELLTADEAKLKEVTSLFEFLISDTEIFIDSFYKWSSSLKLAAQQFLSQQFRIALITNMDHIDQLRISFLTNGKELENPCFYLTVFVQQQPIKYTEYIPIAYNQYSLPTGFYFNNQNKLIEKFFTASEIKLGKTNAIYKCLHMLNYNTTKNVIDHCDFFPNLKTFEPTQNGIIFFNGSKQFTETIKTKFNKNVQNNFPFYLQFNSTLEFEDDKLGEVVFTRQSEFKIEYSNLNQIDSNYLLQKTHRNLNNVKEKQLLQNMINYFQNDYFEIFINVSFLSIFFTIFVLFKKICKIDFKKFKPKKYSKSKPTIQKVITKRIQANKYNF